MYFASRLAGRFVPISRLDTAARRRTSHGSICAAARGSLDPVREVRISSITPSFFWDKRDDAIDPRRGFFATQPRSNTLPLPDGGRSDIAFATSFPQVYSQGAGTLVTQRTFWRFRRLGLIEPLDGGVAG